MFRPLGRGLLFDAAVDSAAVARKVARLKLEGVVEEEEVAEEAQAVVVEKQPLRHEEMFAVVKYVVD